MDLSAAPQLILAISTAVGLSRLLELLVTRRKVRGEGRKIEVDAASVISSELRAWADAANRRADAAEARTREVEARLGARVDELRAELAAAEDAADECETRTARCPGGQPCPLRAQPVMHPPAGTPAR